MKKLLLTLVAAMAVGLTRACLERTTELLASAGVEVDPDRPPARQPAAAPVPVTTPATGSRR